MALHTGLRYPKRLAGIMVLSGYMASPDRSRQEANPANNDMPIFMGHGASDDVVPLELATNARRP